MVKKRLWEALGMTIGVGGWILSIGLATGLVAFCFYTNIILGVISFPVGLFLIGLLFPIIGDFSYDVADKGEE